MADTVVIRLAREDGAPVSWVRVDPTGAASGGPQHGSLSEAATTAAGLRVIAVAPGVDVMLAEPELPVKGGARLAQVAPFALEEQLADDLEDLHFAVGRREGERPGTPVAVVSKERMDAWLGALRDAQLEPQALFVDSSLLPANPSQTVLAIEDDKLYVRPPDRQPFVLQADSLPDALELAGIYQPPAGDEDTAAPEPAHVMAYVTEDDWERHQETLEAARARLGTLNIQLLRGGPLPLFAQQAVLQPPFNLMQGAYASRSDAGASWQRWKMAATLLACLIGLHLVGKGVELWQLKKTETTLDASIAQIFRESMGEQNTQNARRKMETRLTAIRSGGGEGGILQMLSVTGTAVAQVPNTRLNGMTYRNNTLNLRVEAGDMGSLTRLEGLASQNGLTASILSNTNNASGVEGQMQIKGAQSR